MTTRRALPGTWLAPKNMVLAEPLAGATSVLAPHLPQNLLAAGTSVPQLGHIFPGIYGSPGRRLGTLATASTLSGPRRASQGSMCSKLLLTRSDGSRRRRASQASTPGPGRRAKARAAAARTAGMGSAAAAIRGAIGTGSAPAPRAWIAADRTKGEGSRDPNSSSSGRPVEPSAPQRSTAIKRRSQDPAASATKPASAWVAVADPSGWDASHRRIANP